MFSFRLPKFDRRKSKQKTFRKKLVHTNQREISELICPKESGTRETPTRTFAHHYLSWWQPMALPCVWPKNCWHQNPRFWGEKFWSFFPWIKSVFQTNQNFTKINWLLISEIHFFCILSARKKSFSQLSVDLFISAWWCHWPLNPLFLSSALPSLLGFLLSVASLLTRILSLIEKI